MQASGMSEVEQIIRLGMCRNKISTFTELGKRIGYSQQLLSKKKCCPETMYCKDLAQLDRMLNLTDEEIAIIVRAAIPKNRRKK